MGVRDEPVPEGEFNIPLASGSAPASRAARGRLAPEEAPQPRVLRERAERQAGYTMGKKDVSKWQSLVKENREADTIVFKNSLAQGVERAPSTAAMAARVVPQSELEREVAELLKGGGAEGVERAQMDALEAGAEADEGVDEERREKLMKMRHLMFNHEMKQKRVRKIKSKDYHRRLKKKEMRLREKEEAEGDGEGILDLEGDREAREAAEYARAEERLTLRHKNTSRWARRALKRGMANMDETTKKALGEQLRLNEALKRKVEMAGSDSSDSEEGASSDEEGEGQGRGRHSARAQAKVLKELEDDPGSTLPEKGLFSLPFMKRAINRKRQAVQEEAQRLAQELEQRGSDSEGDFEATAMDWGGGGDLGAEDAQEGAAVARRSFGPGAGTKRARVASAARGSGDEEEDNVFEGSSGSEDEGNRTGPRGGGGQKRKELDRRKIKLEGREVVPRGRITATAGPISVKAPPAEPLKLPTGQPDWLFTPAAAGAGDQSRSIKQAAVMGEETTPGTTVAEAASGARKKQRRGLRDDGAVGDGQVSLERAAEDGQGSGAPGQREIIRQAFQMYGEDVQAEFAAEKRKDVERELPKDNGPALMPGWGMWKDQQKVPAWMLRERAAAEKKRADAAARRKDARLKHVIISEKFDKKAAKFSVPEVPFPFKSREDYERSMRMPLGREFMTDKVHRDMTRPDVLKTTGVMIDPLRHLGETLDNNKVKPSGGRNVKKNRPERPKSGRL